jgi:energy-coupling factor transport system permease protein
MKNLAPLCNLIVTIMLSVWTVLIWNPLPLAAMLAVELILIGYAGQAGKLVRPILGLSMVAAFFALIQLPFDIAVTTAVASGLKMMVMTVAFLLLFATTKLPSLTAALVSQARIPYEYAFLFTSALRFVPDFLAESKAVREAQTCRGYVPSRNPVKRLISYAALVEPMVLRAITRSETMAMSLELRGFGNARRTFTQQIAFRGIDYLVLVLLVAVTALVVFGKLS